MMNKKRTITNKKNNYIIYKMNTAQDINEFYKMLEDPSGIGSIHDYPNKAEIIRPKGTFANVPVLKTINAISKQKPNHKKRDDIVIKAQPVFTFKSKELMDDNYTLSQTFTLEDDKDIKIPVELRTKNHTETFNDIDPDIYKLEYEKKLLKYKSKKERQAHEIDELHNEYEFLPPNDYDIFPEKLNIE